MSTIAPHFFPFLSTTKGIKKGGTKKIFIYFIQHPNPVKHQRQVIMKRGAREFVIDGYNLIHKLYPSITAASLEEVRNKTEQQLRSFQQKKKCQITIVYDGKGSYGESAFGAALRIVFTPASKSADHWIIDYVKSLNTTVKMVTIVSSDNEIRRYATAFGATCITSELFATQLQQVGHATPLRQGKGLSGKATEHGKKTNETLLSEREVAGWMQLFTQGKS